MNFQQMLSTMISRLGEREDMEERIIAELANAQENLELSWEDDTMPWFLVRRGAIDVPAMATVVSLPDDFIREYEPSQPEMDNVPMVPVFEERMSRFWRDWWWDGCHGKYAILGTTLEVNPSEDDRQFWLTYYARQPALSHANPENLWSRYGAECLMSVAGGVLATFIRDPELAQLFVQKGEVEKQKIIAASKSRLLANMDMRIEVR